MTLSAAGSCTRVRRWVPLCLIAVLACSDDAGDVVIDAGARPSVRDAGSAPTGKPDAHMDAARPNNSKDSAVDASDASREVCTRDIMPAWDYFQNVTRVSLEVFCANTPCPASLEAIESTLSCTDADVDAGNDTDAGAGSCNKHSWLRREGCGKVEFDVWLCDWPRVYCFDANTGAVIGGASLDDIGMELRGTSCFDAAYIAGELLKDCASVTTRTCVRKP